MAELNVNTGVPSRTPPSNALAASLARGLASPQMGAIVALAAALTLGVGLILFSLRPDFVPVSERGGREHTLEVIDALRNAGIEYRLDGGTGLVLVSRDRLQDARLQLHAGGLGGNDPIGLELLHEEPSFGTSQFNETARYQHGLETELSRTISAMRNIESARVHLALPRQSVFVRDRAAPSASVMVKPAPGRTIDDPQVEAITGLVASSIPYLKHGQVTVVDQWGRLLSSPEDSLRGATREQFDYTRRLERLYAERVESLLSPLLGSGRVHATVTADIDFSMNERTEESFEPDAAQLRSEQTDSQISRDRAAAGIPGALTNQPPNEGELAEDAADPELAAAEPVNESASAVRNYELDKTITHVRQSPGTIRRLSAAVVVDNVPGFDEAGEPISVPLGEEEIAQYTALVQEAIGFVAQRGDTVVLQNRAFQPPVEIEPPEAIPFWEQDWVWNGVRQSLIGLAVLLIVLTVVRPAARRLAPPVVPDPEPDPEALARLEAEKEKENNVLAAPNVVYGDILNMARAMAAEDPKRVAIVVKDWVREG